MEATVAGDCGWCNSVERCRGPATSQPRNGHQQTLEGIGLTDHEMDHLLTAVLAMTVEAARWEIGPRRVRARSGLGHEQW